jgi:hypothetical protein
VDGGVLRSSKIAVTLLTLRGRDDLECDSFFVREIVRQPHRRVATPTELGCYTVLPGWAQVWAEDFA